MDKNGHVDKVEVPDQREDINGDSFVTPRKGGILNTLYPPGPKGGAGSRMKNHCRKFWWCDFLVFAAVALIIVLPIIYVGIPKIAQHDLDESTLEVTEQVVADTQPDHFHLKLESTARSDSSFHPTIEGFTASLSLPGQPAFIRLDVPETKAEAETFISVDQDVTIADIEAFKAYNKVVMNNETFDVYMEGKTKIHQSGLSAISVDYRKKVTMKGLNKLSGLTITDMRVLSGDNVLEDNSNMVGNVIIPNPSVMTIDLGNVTMDLSVDGQSIGTSLLPDFVLRPGTNNVSMQSRVDQLQIVSLIRTKYSNAILPFEIVGNSSMRGDQHLEYLEAAIQSNTIKMDLDVGPALAGVGINVTDIA